MQIFLCDVDNIIKTIYKILMKWNQLQIEFLKNNYPDKGKEWCARSLGLSSHAIRMKACRLNLKINKQSDFIKEAISKQAKARIGKERPKQSLVMKMLHEEGKLKKTKDDCKKISERMKIQWKTIPHPRGMLGKKHSKETLNKISNSNKNMWKNMSDEMKDAHSLRTSINSRKITKNRESASWKCGHRQIGDIKRYYRSAWEANFARYLQYLKEKNQITNWEHEPHTFWFNGIKRGVLSYLPDFRVTETNGDIVYYEVKGWMDDRSKTKIKRMAKYHPDVKLIVIDSKAYKKLASQISGFINGWE